MTGFELLLDYTDDRPSCGRRAVVYSPGGYDVRPRGWGGAMPCPYARLLP